MRCTHAHACTSMRVLEYTVRRSLIKEALFLTSLMSHSHTESVIHPHTLWLLLVTGSLISIGEAEIESCYSTAGRSREGERDKIAFC